ncbi:hypothetical protein HAX54_004851, partial [Datura stramonium]|nr:hypothetical protein [Datura stramonium]
MSSSSISSTTNRQIASSFQSFVSISLPGMSISNVGKSLVMRSYLGLVAFNNITRLTFGKRFINSQGKDDNEALKAQDSHVDRFTRVIMAEHTLARKKTGETKQHFVDALLTLQKEYELSDDTVIGLLG